MKNLNKSIIALTCATLLSACSGGGDSSSANNTTGQTNGNSGAGTGTNGNNTNVYSTVEITDSEFDEFQSTGLTLVATNSNNSVSYAGSGTGRYTYVRVIGTKVFVTPRADDTYREFIEDIDTELPYSYRYTEGDEVLEYFDTYDGVLYEHDGADRLETASNFVLAIDRPTVSAEATHIELLYNGEVYKRLSVEDSALWQSTLEANFLN